MIIGNISGHVEYTEEIAEVRLCTLDELQGPIRHALLATGKGLYNYRVKLTDTVVGLLGI